MPTLIESIISTDPENYKHIFEEYAKNNSIVREVISGRRTFVSVVNDVYEKIGGIKAYYSIGNIDKEIYDIFPVGICQSKFNTLTCTPLFGLLSFFLFSEYNKMSRREFLRKFSYFSTICSLFGFVIGTLFSSLKG